MTYHDLINPNVKSGDALRDMAANLLSQKFGRVQTEKRISGKKVDVYFEVRSLGKQRRHYLEAKDYDAKLQRQQVVNIKADYEGILRQNGPSELLIVSRYGLSPDAEAYIDENDNVSHLTIWELENEVLGLSEYVKQLSQLHSQDGLDHYYLDCKARRVSYDDEGDRTIGDTELDLFAQLSAWLESDSFSPIAILGGYGAGKSSFAKKLVAHQAMLALDDATARRPVLIELGDCTRFSKLEGLLGAKFTHDFPIQSFNAHTFLKLNELGRMLIVLDGFDEMKHAMTWPDFRRQIETLNQLTKGNSKVVLLGRPSAFTSNDEHMHVLRGMRRSGDLLRKLPDWPEFIEYEISPFDDSQRAIFVQKYLDFKAPSSTEEGWVQHRANEVNVLADADAEIFSKPVHIKILTDLALDRNVDLSLFKSGISRWTLYTIFFESLAEREQVKEARTGIDEQTRLSFVRELAYWMWTKRDGVTAFSFDDINDQLLAECGTSPDDDLDAIKRELLVGSFLEKKSGDVFYFGHRSFAEFLVAQQMLLRIPGASLQPEYSHLFKDGVEVFLKECPDKNTIALWADGIVGTIGYLDIEYINFLIDAVGGMAAFRNKIKHNVPMHKALGVFEDHIVLNSKTLDNLFKLQRDPNTQVFLLAQNLIQLQYAYDDSFWDEAELHYRQCAAVLERLFANVEWQDNGISGSISEDFQDARTLALALITSSRFKDGRLTFQANFSNFLRAMEADRFGMAQFRANRGYTVSFMAQTNIPFDDLRPFLEAKTEALIFEYFKRHETPSAIFVSATKVSPKKTAPNKRWNRR